MISSGVSKYRSTGHGRERPRHRGLEWPDVSRVDAGSSIKGSPYDTRRHHA
jgi:hypothetical protein